MSSWVVWLADAWPALLLSLVGLELHRASRNPKASRGDVVLLDLCLGLVAVVASVLWLQVLVLVVF